MTCITFITLLSKSKVQKCRMGQCNGQGGGEKHLQNALQSYLCPSLASEILVRGSITLPYLSVCYWKKVQVFPMIFMVLLTWRNMERDTWRYLMSCLSCNITKIIISVRPFTCIEKPKQNLCYRIFLNFYDS